MKINQIITENFDGEYDDEAGMVQSNLYTIAKAAQGLLDTIDDHDNLPEWVQEKIAKVEGMMVTSWNYLQSQKAQGIDPQIAEGAEKRCRQCGMKNCKCPGDSCKCKPIAGWVPGKGFKKAMDEAANAAQQAAIAISMKKAHKKPKNEDVELAEEFDLIESIIERLAEHNGVDAELIWEDLETLSEDELYAFAVTSEPIMEGHQRGEYSRVLTALQLYWPRLSMEELNTPGYHKVIANKADVPVEYAAQVIDGFANDDDEEDDEEQGVAESEAWQKANNRDKTDGMSQKAVNTYRREHPGSKLKTAVTTKPSKLKKGSKASKRRSSYCSRSRGQMKMHSISCSKTPDKAICKARRRWNC
jgi:hypothetical protein